MKLKNISTLLALAALSTINSQLAAARAQGSLTPPAGLPAPVMKSLDQVEARTPVNTLPGDGTATHVITLPGSYYLTGSISGNSGKAGIRVDAVNVTLDLNGFTLEAVSGSTYGIDVISAGGPIRIRNGQLRFWANTAIRIANPSEFVIEDLTISSGQNGGVSVNGNGRIERVNVVATANAGISATDTSRVAIRNCRVENVTSSGTASGILAALGQISDCYVGNVQGDLPRGIDAINGSVGSSTVRQVVQTGSTAGTIYGIRAARIVGCETAGITNNAFAGNATGIKATTNSGQSGLVSRSTVNAVYTAGGAAIGIETVGAVHESTVMDVSGGNSPTGIDNASLVRGCDVRQIAGTGNSSAYGIEAAIVEFSNVSGITNSSTGSGCGILVSNPRVGGHVHGCRVTHVKTDGIFGATACVIEDNSVAYAGLGGTGSGINALSTSGIRIVGNSIVNAPVGISSVISFVIRNTAESCTTPYSMSAYGTGPIISASGVSTNLNPNANFSF